jgi:hypothetical protein
MKKTILPIIILIRLLTNDGFFNENRNIKIKQQPPEVRSAIRRTWRRGRKLLGRPEGTFGSSSSE